jgi:hypothetical protein
MCAPSWEILVKKSELNAQKLALLSGYGPSPLTTANNDRSQSWFRSQPPSQVSQQPKFLSQLSWIMTAVLADSRSTSSPQATTTPGSRRSGWSLHSASSMKSFSMSNRPIICRIPPPSPSSRKKSQGKGCHRTHSQRWAFGACPWGPIRCVNVVGHQECVPGHEFAEQVGRPPTFLHCFHGGW